MQVSDLITKLRLRTADNDDASYASDMLVNFTNKAQKDFASTTASCRTITNDTTTLTSTNSTYDVSNLTGELLGMYRLDLDYVFVPFSPIYEEIDFHNVSAGTPTAWTLWGDTVGGSTTSIRFNAAVTATTVVTMHYSYIPDDLTSTSSTLSVPDKWVHALVPYMEYLCHKQDRDIGLAQVAYAEYDSIRKAAAFANQAFLSHGGYT